MTERPEENVTALEAAAAKLVALIEAYENCGHMIFLGARWQITAERKVEAPDAI